MYAAISPSDRLSVAPALAGIHGVARIGYAWDGGASRLATLEQRSPLRVLFPRPAAGDPPIAALVTTSGGLVGGDRLDVAVSVITSYSIHYTKLYDTFIRTGYFSKEKFLQTFP